MSSPAVGRTCTGVVAACIVAMLAGPVGAAPWDGPRRFDGVDRAYPLYPSARAFAIVFAPGARDSADPAERPHGPARIEVDGVVLRSAGWVASPRWGAERYDVIKGRGDAPRIARALLALPGVVVAGPMFATDPSPRAPLRALTDRLLLQLVDGSAATERAMRDLAASLGIVVVSRRGAAPNQWLLRVPRGAPVDPVEAAMRLHEASCTRWAQVDWLVPMAERYLPTDSDFSDQWHLDNRGQFGGVPDQDVNAAEAWDVVRGDPAVIVGVLDSGVQTDHPELAANLLPGWDFVDGDPDPSPNGSHGTSVAGLVGAIENGTGVVGVCPQCRLLPVRVLGAGDSGQADAHDFAVQEGAFLINNSWGPQDGTGTETPIPPVVATAIDNAVENGRGGLGTAVFWAAGNGHPTDSCDQDGYVSYANTIAVGASTNLGIRSSYSERCEALALSAPSNGGTAGLTTTRTNGGITSAFGGTSAATPVATGAAALLLAAIPDLEVPDLLDLLESTAQKIDTANGSYDGDGHSTSYGFGRVDAYGALLNEIAILDVPDGPLRCEGTVAVVLRNVDGEGDERVLHVSSDSEPAGEDLVFSEGDDDLRSAVVTIGGGLAVAGDGVVQVAHGDTLLFATEGAVARAVPVDCQGPQVLDWEIRELLPRSAAIWWSTDEPASAEAIWGQTPEDRNFDATVGTEHLVLALSLAPCTLYEADLVSTDPSGLATTLADTVAWRTPGDPADLPDDAPDGADPCDPTTWAPDPPDDDDATPTQPGELSGNGCVGCASSVGGAGASVGWLLALVAIRRRR